MKMEYKFKKILRDYYFHPYVEERIHKNPMDNVEMMKKANFLSSQGKEDLPECDAKGDYANPNNLRKRLYRIDKATGIKTKGLHAFRHTFAAKLINGTKCADGSVKTLNIKAVADILGHTTTEITERYYVKKDTSRLTGIADGFEI